MDFGNLIEFDIVAIPRLKASPEYTWINVNVNWLSDSNMLQQSQGS